MPRYPQRFGNHIPGRFIFLLLGCLVVGTTGRAEDAFWPRYTIDDSFRGADGVRLADANADGLPDIATGWEESGLTRVYLHPGAADVSKPWPAVTVGRSPSVEDAVWVDVGGDGRLDVLSSCEGGEQSLRLHVAPKMMANFLDENAWQTHVVPASEGQTRWMFAFPVNGMADALPAPAPSLGAIVGSKSPHGMVGLLDFNRDRAENESASVTGDQLEKWTTERLCSAQWIMSLFSCDVDRDGDWDVLFTDRKGEQSGVYWLENPGSGKALNADGSWKQHLIGGRGQEVMFMQLIRGTADWPRASRAEQARELVVAVKPHQISWFREGTDCRAPWSEEVIPVSPQSRIGNAKGVAAGDLTGDGRLELVLSCESADEGKSGVVYLNKSHTSDGWHMHDVSGPEGIKFDRIELVDLDLDGDLDILTCEERAAGRGLGVIWYANPASH